ncbi:hypothetical protein AB0M48_21390 [Lentzea sp. NPDC051208]|uniref:hypothetical protein n=1 Tax=Lentzea sp. NPDC051208 TaxID=3154642 RepID=UPI003434870F
MGELEIEVEDLHWGRIPYFTRYRINRRRKRRETGLLMFTTSRTSVRHTASRYFRINQVRENGEVLAESDSQLPFSKFRRLSPGVHQLVLCSGTLTKEVSVSREVELKPGQLLVVGCRPSYSYRPFNKNPPPDRWSIGVLDPR